MPLRFRDVSPGAAAGGAALSTPTIPQEAPLPASPPVDLGRPRKDMEMEYGSLTGSDALWPDPERNGSSNDHCD